MASPFAGHAVSHQTNLTESETPLRHTQSISLPDPILGVGLRLALDGGAIRAAAAWDDTRLQLGGDREGRWLVPCRHLGSVFPIEGYTPRRPDLLESQ